MHLQRYGSSFLSTRRPQHNNNNSTQQPSQDYFSLTLAQRAVFDRNAKKRADAAAVANRRKQSRLARTSATIITISSTPLFQQLLSIAGGTDPREVGLGPMMVPPPQPTATIHITNNNNNDNNNTTTPLLTLALSLKKPILVRAIKPLSVATMAATASTTTISGDNHQPSHSSSTVMVDLPLFVTCDCCGYSKEIWNKDVIVQTTMNSR